MCYVLLVYQNGDTAGRVVVLLLVCQRVKTLKCCCVVVGVPESEDTDVLLCWCARE